MSERLPRITASQIIKVLEKEGFFLSRQSGRHKIYKDKEGKRVTVSHHFAEDLTSKALKEHIRGCRLDSREAEGVVMNKKRKAGDRKKGIRSSIIPD